MENELIFKKSSLDGTPFVFFVCMYVPFIKEGIDDLASNGVESQIADVLQVTSAEM